MTKAEEARNWAQSRIGCPYIYGGTGQPCTPSYREARAAQYPEYADKIRKNCPRLSGKTDSCTDCKWCDPDTNKGKRAYDCAQLVRWCMDHIGISMVSGANSQWQKTDWEEAGSIDTIPRGKVCLVYREDDDGKKHHTGIYCGDGYIIHAKGHDYGVVKELLGNPKFTHWGIPRGLYSELPAHPTLRKGMSGAAVKELQTLLNKYGYGLTVDGNFGNKTYNALRQYQASNGLTVDGVCGPKTWAALGVKDEPAPEPAPEQPDLGGDYFILPMADARRLVAAVDEIYKILHQANWGDGNG